MAWRSWLLCSVIAVGCTSSGARAVKHAAGDATGALAPSAAAIDAPAIISRDYVETKGALLDERSRDPSAGFGKARGWLNAVRPPLDADLKGRVVVIDFWTSCCINCMQTLPTLARLEKKHEHDPVVVIGVHTQKFDAEPEPARLRAAVIREGIRHAVAIDGDRGIWESWGVSAWPTVVVLDAKGRIAWSDAGEPSEAELDAAIESALAEGKRQGLLAKTPATFIGREIDPERPLAYPEKLARVPGGIAIADSGHDRVVLADESGKLLDVVGDGTRGFVDGSYESARFAHPQGLVGKGDVVYVADTGNHAIRAIDRKKRLVRTIAGTGSIGHERLSGEVEGKTFALRSPWDLTFVGETLYVALAGSHQIAIVDPSTSKVRLFAGSGRENRLDGALLDAAFAQPSGLASDGRDLFVLDSETSSVRRIDISKGEVHTLVGKALFVWGDVDGEADRARLQHPIGLSYGDGALWVADTYNGKVKRIDPSTGETHAIAIGTGKLAEPAGITWTPSGLLVADTNAGRIVRIDKALTKELALVGLSAPKLQP